MATSAPTGTAGALGPGTGPVPVSSASTVANSGGNGAQIFANAVKNTPIGSSSLNNQPGGSSYSAPSSSPSLIVTSNSSRNNYASNVNTLTAAQAAANAAEMKNGTLNFANGSTGKVETTPAGQTVKAPGQVTGTQTAPLPGTTIAPDGTITVGGAAPTAPTAAPTGTATAPAGSAGALDPSIQAQFDASGAALDSRIATAQATLTQATMTLANDPAAAAAVNTISSQYGILYQAMQDKNKMVIGRTNAAIGAFGGLGEMSQDFMSEEMDRASQNLADVLTKESNAIIKSNQAYQAGDLKAFDDATTALKDAQNSKLDEITKLATATNNAVKTVQAQAKIDAAAQKQTFTDMNTYATSSAAGIAAATKGMNASDKAAFINSFVQSAAQSMGLTPDEANTFLGMVNGQSTKADQTATKNASSEANINSEITSRTQAAQIAAAKAANGGSTNPSIKFDKPTTIALTSAGLSGADIKVLGQVLYLYPAQSIIDNPKTPAAAVSVLESLYGLTKTDASSTPSK